MLSGPLGRRKDRHPADLGVETLRALIDRTGIDPAIVDAARNGLHLLWS